MQTPSGRRLSASRREQGFALVVTVSLMTLLAIIAVGLLALSSVSLRSSSSRSAQAAAQANARMALLLAIGELQKMTGPDQRVTMTSGLRPGAEPANPNWTGATDVRPAALTPDAKNATIQWLVSGVNPDPARALANSTQLNQGDALKLGTYSSSPGAATDLLAPVVNITHESNPGRYAWWIGDEGTKARVDVAKPKRTPATDRERLAQSQSPLEGGLANLGDSWSGFAPAPGGTIDKTALISLPTASLAAADRALPSKYFNDLTTGGHGLPVNVTTGGMKADLSLIFDRSQLAKKFGELYCGATPSATPWNGAQVYKFATKTPSKFYLSEAISRNGTLQTGPNWGNLWNYATLWQAVAGQQMPMVGGHPLVEADLRYKTWLPYTNHDQGNYRRDLQQTNSPVAPVLSFFQMGFRLNSELAPPTTPPSSTVFYKAQIGIQPVLGLWNPYNVVIKAAPYRFDWALYPYLRFNYAKPTGTGSFTDGRLTKLWLREEWTAGTSVIPTPGDGSGGKWLQLETPSVDLQPGEFRLFSVVDRIRVQAGQTYALKPGWSEKGAFIVDLTEDSGNVRLVPAGYRAWFGDIVLQDTQSSEVKTKFPSLDVKAVSSTWFTLKSGNNILLRSTEIWNGGTDPSVTTAFKVPEPVVSGSSGGLNTSKTTYLIDDLAGDKVTPNIATWSFFLRTTNQMEAPDENQRLRGWVDSNPRALVTNSLWDGSKVASNGERSGWHTTSQFMGAWNAPGKPRVVGDGRGGNRGLLAEGGSAGSEPEVSKSGGRYQGFGGAANKPYESGGPGDDDPFWQGWRNLSEAELDRLAGEIVKEVKERGPFRSLAEFVNRNPKATNPQHQLKGTLQAALDRTANVGFPTSVGKAATQPPGNHFSAAVTAENVAVGSASYLMQGDVLQSLAPILQVRSDYFRIRACGEAMDAGGKVIARAWCEAFVQRTSDYLDRRDQAHKNPTELTATANKTFGRRYEVVSFRWLSSSDIHFAIP